MVLHLLAAVNVFQNGCDGTGGSGCGLAPSTGLSTTATTVTTTLLEIVGAIAVIMVVIGGLRYVLSAGNPKATEDAKNTILYAIVGLAVASLAYAITQFVTGNLHT